jgi:hypothetical protein
LKGLLRADAAKKRRVAGGGADGAAVRQHVAGQLGRVLQRAAADLGANLYVLKVPSARLKLPYAALLASLAVSVLVPFDIFLSGGIVWRYVLPCLLAPGPMLFAGIIFARSLRDEPHPEHAFGSNIAGSMIGGLAEQFSTLLGFQHLLILAICFYLLSTWTPALRVKLSPAE